jgi:DNA helicase-2/ATP-dependent DNA helicase PcrA
MRLLRSHGSLVGVDPDFEVLDDDEREQVVAQAAQESSTPERYFFRWSFLRVRRLEVREESVQAFGEAYERLKRAENVVDFDDLIVYAAQLLEDNPLLAESVGGAHPHILVDELQDTNPAQFAIVRALCEHAKTVSVFADDDQAIYQFAGAEPANITRFIEELEAVRYPLTTNYRCRSAIVDRANRLIAADASASGRRMTAHHDGGEVRSRAFPSIDEEAETLASEILDLVESEGVRPAEIAILGRRRTRLTRLVEGLESVGIPVSNWLGPAFEADERQALSTCLCVSRGSLTPRQTRRICEFLDVDETDERDPDVLLAAHSGVKAAVLLAELRELIWSGADISTIVGKAQDAVALQKPDYAKGLAAISDAVKAFQDHDPEFGIDHLLAELALGGIHGAPTSGGGVKVASLHRAKGLQWPRVYLVGLEDGMLPDFRADTPLSMREERRACFVGVCRAEQHLTLCRVRADRTWIRQPSAFIREMGFASSE